METESIIRKWAIQNRLQHGKANEKAVIGRVISEAPEAKKDMKNLMSKIKSVVSEVNMIPEEELKDFKLEKRSSTREHGLKLPGSPGEVVMRFAPNPNGPATLGSARGMVVNSFLAKKYGGKFILRFDDTDPKNKKPMPEAYKWYLEDCGWLGAQPDEVYYASDRIESYYTYAKDLIKKGHAYVCFCPREKFKELRDSKKACPHRDSSPKENLGLWEDMLTGKFSDGECVLRIKTDIEHKDPALRDWVAFRIVREDHPRVGDKFIVWPMLDFESGIEDHVLGVTHIIRGKDLTDSEHRQRFVYDYFGWTYPETMHWGRVKVKEFGKFSTSGLRRSIESGEFSGWDDPRVPTLRAMQRRGISPEAVKNLMVGLGISDVDISISLENLYAENRKVMDPVANRYFFIKDPALLSVSGAPEMEIKIPLHPSFRDRGVRKFELGKPDGALELFIPRKDASKLREGDVIRLMSLFNVRVDSIDPLKASYIEEKRLDTPKIEWVKDHLKARLVSSEGVFEGFCEPSCKSLSVGDVVQFERLGFARLDSKEDLTFVLSHV